MHKDARTHALKHANLYGLLRGLGGLDRNGDGVQVGQERLQLPEGSESQQRTRTRQGTRQTTKTEHARAKAPDKRLRV